MLPNIDLLPFSPDSSGVALYQQVADWIELNIRVGKWALKAKLPTVRAMAEHLSLNRGAIASAYAHLIRKGVLTARVGRGTYVLATPSNATADHSAAEQNGQFWDPLLIEAANRLGLRAHAINSTSRSAIWVPDRGEVTEDQRHLPLDMPLADHSLTCQAIQLAIHEVADKLSKKALSYNQPQGAYELRESITYLAASRRIKVTPRDILIVNGAQDALSLIASLLIRPGDSVVTENPSYPGAIRAFRMAKAHIIGIPVDGEGMRTDLLEDVLKNRRPSLIYTIPSFQAPTGATQSRERRIHLYSIAAKYNIPIVEDEYVNDLYYGEPPPDTIKSIDENQLVIYVGTFSKTLGAGIRLGWIAAHASVIAQLVQVKEVRDIHSSIFGQLVIEHLLREDLYDKLLIELRNHYHIRHDTMLNKITDQLGIMPSRYRYSGGFSLWVQLPHSISAAEWLAYARVRGAPFEDVSGYFVNPEQNTNFLKLCFSLLSLKDIDMAVDILGNSMKELSNHTGIIHRNDNDHFLPFV